MKILPQHSEVPVHWVGRISYEEGLKLQAEYVEKKQEVLLLLEHEPVYTIGRTTDQSSLEVDRENLPYEVFETNRGGQATYHGPGQLVGYPILDLANRGKDLHALLRFIEELLIISLAQYNIEGERKEDYTGVWVDNKKIASIGIGVRRWVSMHGFAINLCGDLSPFSKIIPCGIEEVNMTSLDSELPASSDKISVLDFSKEFSKIFGDRLDLLSDFSNQNNT